MVAAGQGRRLGGIPKQYRELAGVPVLLRALRPFVAHPDVAQTVIVLPPDELASPPSWLAPLRSDSLRLVPGGSVRRESVAAGLAALGSECVTVLVHDAARPLVDRATIDAVLATARQGVGAVPALPMADTVKETADPAGGRVVRTIPREHLWRAQTPQGFPRAVLERAHQAARRAGIAATDDAELVERLGLEVRVVPGSVGNVKVTTQDDFRLMEALLRLEG